jgi:hypothetical protein
MSHHTRPTDGFFVAWGAGEADPNTTQPAHVHYGDYTANEVVATGQPQFEFFDTEEEMQAKIESLGKVYESVDDDPPLPV